jgi:hypothetical protein
VPLVSLGFDCGAVTCGFVLSGGLFG